MWKKATAVRLCTSLLFQIDDFPLLVQSMASSLCFASDVLSARVLSHHRAVELFLLVPISFLSQQPCDELKMLLHNTQCPFISGFFPWNHLPCSLPRRIVVAVLMLCRGKPQAF